VNTYIRVSAAIFTLVCVLQALRAARGWPLEIAGTSIPISTSIVAAVIAGALGAWGWSTARRASA
jgi:hypothetical protein